MRPRTLGELLDAAFTLYRRNFFLIAAISAVVEIPSALLQYALLRGAGLSGTPDGARLTEVTAFSIAQFLLIQPLIQGAVTRAVSELYLDRATTVGACYRSALLRLRSLIAMSLMLVALLMTAVIPAVAIGVAAGQPAAAATLLILALPPVIYGAVRVSFAAPAIVIEGVSGGNGLRRSWALCTRSWSRVFGILFLVAAMVAIMSGTISGFLDLPSLALGEAPRLVVMSVATAVTSVFVTPIQLIVVTLLYYDLRIRREAFDLEVLAASL